MSSRLSLPAATLLATIVWAAPAGAETFKLTAPDGTVHFTNAPSDPQYQRMGVTSGTDAGWLRLPDGDTAPYLQEIRDAAERHGLPFKLVSAVIRSRFSQMTTVPCSLVASFSVSFAASPEGVRRSCHLSVRAM